jgi:hypothetical protein
MHSSVNIGAKGDVAVFLTVGHGQDDPVGRPRAHPHRRRRAWLSDEGSLNFEGGCCRKTIRLSHIYEPDIYSRRGASAPSSRTSMDPLDAPSSTSSPSNSPRTRARLPLHFISNHPIRHCRQPSTVIFRLRTRSACCHRLRFDARDQACTTHFRLHGRWPAPRSAKGANGDLRLLWRAVHAAPPGPRPHARRAAGPPRRGRYGWSTPAGAAARMAR